MPRLNLDEHDEALVQKVREGIDEVERTAHKPISVIKRIVTYAVRRRNQDRAAAIRRHPFLGVCEASGLPLADNLKQLDELDPEEGHKGRVRSVCSKANNGGKHSCGSCWTDTDCFPLLFVERRTQAIEGRARGYRFRAADKARCGTEKPGAFRLVGVQQARWS